MPSPPAIVPIAAYAPPYRKHRRGEHCSSSNEIYGFSLDSIEIPNHYGLDEQCSPKIGYSKSIAVGDTSILHPASCILHSKISFP